MKYGVKGYVSEGEAVVPTGRLTRTGRVQVAKYDHDMTNLITGKKLTVESKFNTSGLTSNQAAAKPNVTTAGGLITHTTNSQQLANVAQGTAQSIATGATTKFINWLTGK